MATTLTAPGAPTTAIATSEGDGACAATFVPFPLLADPSTYNPWTFDYNVQSSRDPSQPVALKEWLGVFRKSIPSFRTHALQDPAVPAPERAERTAQFEGSFAAALDALLARPGEPVPGVHPPGPANAASLCFARDACLAAAGFGDVFATVKAAENAKALALLPGVLAGLDAIDDDGARLEAALRGVFAGNIFDLGAAESAARYEEGGVSFAATRDKLLPRPWAVDDLDAALAHFARKRHAKAILFVDNAGADVLLGMLPLARELLRRGAAVVLAANEHPTINDVTAAELDPLLRDAAVANDAALAAALASGRLRVVSSGSGLPLIDLRVVSPALAAASEGADLVVLEGMGRGIESNLRAAFKCDALKLGMIKHPEVARCLGGRMYDVVIRLDAAP